MKDLPEDFEIEDHLIGQLAKFVRDDFKRLEVSNPSKPLKNRSKRSLTKLIVEIIKKSPSILGAIELYNTGLDYEDAKVIFAALAESSISSVKGVYLNSNPQWFLNATVDSPMVVNLLTFCER